MALGQGLVVVVLGLVDDSEVVVLGLAEGELRGWSVFRLDPIIVASTNVRSLGPSHSNPALWQRLQMGRSRSYDGIRHVTVGRSSLTYRTSLVSDDTRNILWISHRC
jgi:hypothetical protein